MIFCKKNYWDENFIRNQRSLNWSKLKERACVAVHIKGSFPPHGSLGSTNVPKIYICSCGKTQIKYPHYEGIISSFLSKEIKCIQRNQLKPDEI